MLIQLLFVQSTIGLGGRAVCAESREIYEVAGERRPKEDYLEQIIWFLGFTEEVRRRRLVGGLFSSEPG